VASSPSKVSEPVFKEPGENPVLRWGLIALGVVLLLAIGWFVYVQLTGTLTTKVKDDQAVTAVTPMTPPPPPPPPPPKPEEKPPEPTDAPKPTPEPAAAPKPDAPAPMTQNAPAQAGTDSFGLQAGSGSGSGAPGGTGTCIGTNCGKAKGGGIQDGLYRRYLSGVLQQAVSSDSRVNKQVFTGDFEIVLTSDGRIERVVMRRGSGKENVDSILKRILENVRGLNPPPVTSRYPVLVTVRGRSQLGR
jgi:outer membrane biosynthesis protein TonB